MKNITNVSSLIRTISSGMEGYRKPSSGIEKVVIYLLIYLLGFVSGMLYCLIKVGMYGG